METTIVYWELYRDNGKKNGNYYSILGLYKDKGQHHKSSSRYLVRDASERVRCPERSDISSPPGLRFRVQGLGFRV